MDGIRRPDPSGMDMTLSQSWQGRPESAPDRVERRRAFQAARRHSRTVRRLRFLLPLAGALGLAAFVLLSRLGMPGDFDVTVAGTSVTANAIIMQDPKITGFDAEDRGYSLSADRAIQALARPDEVRLEDIEAEVSVAGGGSATVKAEAGDYDRSENTLKLHGVIAVDSSEGYSLRMTDAAIDLGAGTIASPNPVTVGYADSQTTGGSLSVTGGGQVIVLQGAVRTTLMPPKRRRPGPATPASTGQE